MTREDGVTPIRVMLVEDDANFRRLMASLFDRQSELEVVPRQDPWRKPTVTPRRPASTWRACGSPDGDGTDLIPSRVG